MPVWRAAEISRRPEKGPRNDPADAIRIGLPSREPANFIKLGEREDFFMRRNLENGVGGSVENRVPGLQMFFPEFGQDLSAAASVVADEGDAGVAFDAPDQFLGKARESGEGFFQDHTRDFPMSGRRVLARGAFPHPAKAGGQTALQPGSGIPTGLLDTPFLAGITDPGYNLQP